MSVSLLYNNQLILSGQATPFVGREDSFVRYGDRWADKTTISLAGQITGCTYDDLIAAQTRLVNVFSADFQQFSIIQDNTGIFTADYAIIKQISFPSSPYSYTLNYNVTLDCFEQDLFTGTFGVLDPTDEWAYEERADYTVTLTHNVGARGFNTNSGISNALTNARTFVMARTGLANAVTPAFTNLNQPVLSFCLKTLRENIDRFNGSYSIEETYLADSYYGLDGLLRYTSTFDCNTFEGMARVTVDGTIDACGRSASMDTIRERYNELDLFTIAHQTYVDAGAPGDINMTFVSNGIVEDIFNKKISFNRTYDNNPDPLVYLDYSLTITTSENEITTVTFNGTIKGRGDLTTRWTQVQDFYNTLDPYSYALTAYNLLGLPYPLNTIPNDESTSFNQFNAEITVTMAWDNKDLPPAGFKNFAYTLHFTPSLEKVAANPLANVCGFHTAGDAWYVVDLGFTTRCAFSINGNGRICAPHTINDGITYARQFGNSQFSLYCSSNRAFLEKKSIDTTTDLVTFDFGWSAASQISVTNPPAYSTIVSLALK